MTTPAATSARLARIVMCAALALALGLTCAVLAVALSSGMSGMSGMNSASGMAGMSGVPVARSSTGPATGFSTGSSAAASPVAAGTGGAPSAAEATPQMTSMCDDMCAGITATVVCTAAAGFFLTGLAALLMASPRNTLIGLLARTPRPGPRRRRGRPRTPWLTPSPVSLCVFRV
ncbi:hypothetical protein [Nocardioides aurantiacus]|uniref:hypothetical protein n=1 Tax=Nocardioides aurantiacus TaxID=86796 RepID=UPI0011CEBC9E|nr:hypothetical protein [Nocardioides aurantiacus]